MERAKGIVGSVLALAALAGSSPGQAAPVVQVEDRIEVRVRPMNAEPAEPASVPLTLRPVGASADEGVLVLRWPGSEDRTTVRLRARERMLADDDLRGVLIEAEVEPPGGERTVARRVVSFDDSETVLFEVHRAREKGLTLAVECSTVREVAVTTRRSVGAPVSFRLEVRWVDGSDAVLLETNRLDSFVGEPVMYAFSLDGASGAQSMEVRLEPLRIVGDILQFQMEVSGSLPGGGRPHLVARKERWLTSAGTTSSIDAVEGEPGTGYRFSVTPSFDATAAH